MGKEKKHDWSAILDGIADLGLEIKNQNIRDNGIVTIYSCNVGELWLSGTEIEGILDFQLFYDSKGKEFSCPEEVLGALEDFFYRREMQ